MKSTAAIVTDESARTTVLVVENEQHLADLYGEYLPDRYDVRTAYNGADALETLDQSVDVVLLDRRMPVMSGNEVLAAIENRDVEVRVAMVTAVDPDFDIIDLGVDDYVVKPVSKDTLVSVVERLETVAEYNDRQKRLTAKKLKRNVLEVEKARPELEASERFSELQAEIESLEAEVEALETEITDSRIER